MRHYTSGTGTSCTLTMAAIDASSETTEWTVYDYNPSNQAIAPPNSPNSMPATTPDGGMTWQFPFRPNIYTALFTTTDPSMTGDLSAKTLNVTVRVDGGAGMFQYRGNCGSPPAKVRFYFTSPKASGPACATSATATPPDTGFYTQFWWSNPVSVPLFT